MQNQNTQNQNNELLRKVLRQAQENIRSALELLGMDGASSEKVAELITRKETGAVATGRTIEGIFDGQKMIGGDGQSYSVPPNYASKSKLVNGDRLKLAISLGGNFIFKQIGPVERNRLVGTLALDPATKQYVVTSGERQWKVLTASVTFYRGEPGDETVILIPQNGESAWAAVDNIVKQSAL
ncbi:hypothetical protein EPN90_01180 [Patescibacteria group bacterium]|nr:MAG: hypothetical protein EPN90_01180 [Patescibacteria group bacterium]